MRISHLVSTAILGTLFITTFSTSVQANSHKNNLRQHSDYPQQQSSSKIVHTDSNNNKRDLIGNIIGNQPPPPPSAPTSSSTSFVSTSGPVGPGISPSATQTGSSGPLPSLVGGALSPLEGSSSSTTPPGGGGSTKKKPTGANESVDGTGSAKSSGVAGSSDDTNDPLSPGLIVLLVIIILAVLAGVLFSCYKVRQSKRRREQSWNEDILKDHAGGVGYTEGGGYGMYVSGNEKPDLWRKNLDMFHRD